MTQPTLPPDQSLRISKLGDRYVLLSVSDNGLVVGSGTPYEHFDAFTAGAYIFAEAVQFTSSISSPNGLTISAAYITSPPGIKLDTTGPRGADQPPNHPDNDAAPGKPAGPLCVYLQNGSDENALYLSYVANGGDGGNVIFDGSRGGNGGNGGRVIRVFQSVYAPLFKAFAAFLARDDVTSGPQDAFVDQNGTVYTAALDLAASSTYGQCLIDDAMQTFRSTLKAISQGENYTLKQLTVDARRVRNAAVDSVYNQSVKVFISSAKCDGGYPGYPEGFHGIAGAVGEPGTQNRLMLPLYDNAYKPLDDAASLRQTPFAFAHPEQCAMLLTRGETFFYMSSPSLRQQATRVFQSILDRLSFLPLSLGDPLYVAYSQSRVMPFDSIERLQSVYNDASTQLMNLTVYGDYNGYASNFVPRASYTFYKEYLDAALTDLAVFEDAYITYHAALDAQEELQTAVGRAVRNTDAMLLSIMDDIQDLKQMLQDADREIQKLAQPVLDAHAALIAEYEILQDSITQSFQLSLPQLANALTSLAFAPGKFMVGLQAVGLVYQRSTSIPNIDGIPVNKNVIIGTLKKSEATVKGITDTIPKDKLDGTFHLDDPYGTRLLTLEDDMMAFLSDYAQSTFANVIDDFKSKFDAYVNAVVARNAQVLQYNIVLNVLVQRNEDRTNYARKRTELWRREIKADDPDLPEITTYIDGIYQSSRARVMKLMNLLIRSLKFRMLKTYDIYTLAFAPFMNMGDVPLSVTSTVLRSARSTVESEFANEVENWGSEPSKFPAAFDDGRGKRVYLKDPARDTLCDLHTVTVSIPPVYEETTPKSDFSGCCNVRIYRARFGFTGLRLLPPASSARVTVRMQHGGRESIVDRRNAAHDFSHDTISIVYSYILRADGSIQVLDNGNIAEADINNQATCYAAPGPFTTWTVSLADSELNRLDFSGVKKGDGQAYFDFCGTDYAYP